MTKRLVFVGTPGCGKTVLCADVFSALKKRNIVTELVSEWIRRSIIQEGTPDANNIFEQYRVLMKHRQEEEKFPAEVEYLVIDSGCISPYFYTALYASKSKHRDRLAIADFYSFLIEDLYMRRYDHIFFIPRSTISNAGFQYQDGVRYQTDDEVHILESMMSLMLTRVHRLDNIHVLDCPIGQRVDAVLKTLGIVT